MSTKRAGTKAKERVSLYRGPLEQSWEPYVEGGLSLFALEHVGYEGLHGASALFAARDVEDIGAFLKVHFALFESVGLDGSPGSPAMKKFQKKHGVVGRDDFDEDEEAWTKTWADALAGEPDGAVARLLTKHVDDDDEGSYCSLVEIDDARWVDFDDDRAAYFARPRSGKKKKLFQVCTSEALSKAKSLFVRARSRAEVFRRIVDPDPGSIFARSLAVLLEVERFPGSHDEMTVVNSAGARRAPARDVPVDAAFELLRNPSRDARVEAMLESLRAQLRTIPGAEREFERMLAAGPTLEAYGDAGENGELSALRRTRIDAMSDEKLEACFDYAYTKGSFESLSVAEAPVPYVVHPSGIAKP